MRQTWLALVIACGGALVASSSARAETAYVQASVANVRSAPEASASLLAKLPIASPVEIEERRGEWARIRTKAASGWVAASLLDDKRPTLEALLLHHDANPPTTSPPGGKGAKRAVALAPRLVPRGGDPSARWRAHARALRHRRGRPRRARPRLGGARPQPDRRRGGPGDRQGGAHPPGEAGSAPPHRGALLPRPAAPPRPPSQADARPPRRRADGGSARAPTRRRRCATTR